MRRPGVEISALDLSDVAAGHPGAGVAASAAEPVIDRQALAAYRARLADIDRDLDEAEQWHDPRGVERLHDERAALLAEIGAVTGLGGRVRTNATDEGQRARVAVRKALAAALRRLARLDPLPGAHPHRHRAHRHRLQLRARPDPSGDLADRADLYRPVR